MTTLTARTRYYGLVLDGVVLLFALGLRRGLLDQVLYVADPMIRRWRDARP